MISLTACSATQDPPQRSSASETPTHAGTESEATTPGVRATNIPPPAVMSIVDRMRDIPASAVSSGGLVVTSDLAFAAAIADVTRPQQLAADEVSAYVSAITGRVSGGGAAFATLPDALPPNAIHRMGEFHDELGWSIGDVTWFVEYQTAGDDLTILGGDFDAADLDAAMGKRIEGLWRVGPEDEDVADIQHATAARPSGETLRMALSDGRLVVARKSEAVKAAVTNTGRTLADDVMYLALAQVMDAAGAYTSCLVAHADFSLANDISARLPTVPVDQAVLHAPFHGLAVGVSDRSGDPVLTVAYAHDDAAAARINADQLSRILNDDRQRWAGMFAVEEIRADGNVVVATLADPDFGLGDPCSWTSELLARHM